MAYQGYGPGEGDDDDDDAAKTENRPLSFWMGDCEGNKEWTHESSHHAHCLLRPRYCGTPLHRGQTGNTYLAASLLWGKLAPVELDMSLLSASFLSGLVTRESGAFVRRTSKLRRLDQDLWSLVGTFSWKLSKHLPDLYPVRGSYHAYLLAFYPYA